MVLWPKKPGGNAFFNQITVENDYEMCYLENTLMSFFYGF